MSSKLRIGIIGGMGPLASIYFESLLCKKVNAKIDQDYPIIINYNNTSIPDRSAYLLSNGDSPIDEIVNTAKSIESIGVDVICMPCNTAHQPIILESVKNRISTPVLNMVELTILDLVQKYPNIKSVGLLATDGTVESRVYHDVAKRHGINIVSPNKSNQQKLMSLIYEIKISGVSSESLETFVSIQECLEISNNIPVLIACTELSLLTPDQKTVSKYVDSLDTLAKHVLQFKKT